MPKVFISYRRDDSFGYAQTIYRELVQHYSKDRVFIDVDTVEPGVDFVYAIENAVGECDVLVALIGKRWANVSKGAKSRLDDPNDFVRLEISTALARNIRVIPLLVDGMKMPSEKMLPTSLKALTRRNAMEISHTRFDYDVNQLTTAVRKVLDATEAKPKADQGKKRNRAPQKAPAQRRSKKERLRHRSEEEANRMSAEPMERLLKFRQTAKLKPGAVFRDKLKDGSQGPEMVLIPAGTFRMGDIDGCGNEYELPVHPVQIMVPFAIGRSEVTFDEYDRFAAGTGHELPDDQGWGRGQRPLIYVSWYDAVEYAKWLSAQTGKRYRLPSEAEWEYAARNAGKEERWAGTSREQELSEYAWYEANSGLKTQPVGSRKPSGLGLYDMSGNVHEWVQDWWHFNYEGAPADGRAWMQGEDGSQRVMRGGSWRDGPGFLRSSFRYRDSATFRNWNIGFRLAQDID